MPDKYFEEREQKRQHTLKTADHHREPWTTHHDELVLARANRDGRRLTDVDLAIIVGRTQLAVSQRRVVLNKLIESGMTLAEIHEVERFNRAQRNSIRARAQVEALKRVCPECFCNPHIPGCPNE